MSRYLELRVYYPVKMQGGYCDVQMLRHLYPLTNDIPDIGGMSKRIGESEKYLNLFVFVIRH